MEQYKAILEFDSYLVKSINYTLNDNFVFEKDVRELEVDFDVNASIEYGNEANYVTLEALAGDFDNPKCPFVINVVLVGVFIFKGSEDDREAYFKKSAVAVLFPYLRSIISEMSAKSNVFPNFKLPLINIIDYLQDKKRTNIIDNRDKNK